MIRAVRLTHREQETTMLSFQQSSGFLGSLFLDFNALSTWYWDLRINKGHGYVNNLKEEIYELICFLCVHRMQSSHIKKITFLVNNSASNNSWSADQRHFCIYIVANCLRVHSYQDFKPICKWKWSFWHLNKC